MKYKIIILKEEPKQELEPLEVPMPIYKHEGKELTNEELMKERSSAYEFINFDKQETLEQVAERILANNIDGLKDALNDNDLFYFYKGVVQCYGEAMAKWKQEQIIDFLQSEITERRDYTASKMCEKAIEFIKKFKNK